VNSCEIAFTASLTATLAMVTDLSCAKLLWPDAPVAVTAISFQSTTMFCVAARSGT
jgi:hypothetical protein